jgi:membrane protein
LDCFDLCLSVFIRGYLRFLLPDSRDLSPRLAYSRIIPATDLYPSIDQVNWGVPKAIRYFVLGCGRIFPDCITVSQAIAFNMFVAFFPALLLALGLLSGTSFFEHAVRAIPYRLNLILPSMSTQVVSDYFLRRGLHPQRWMYLGLGGTLIAGSQVMVGFIESFRMIEGDPISLGYWRRELRAFGMLCLTIVPILLVTAFTVFGKSVRLWFIHREGVSLQFAAELSYVIYAVSIFIFAMTALIVLYRLGRPGHPGVFQLWPGALIATVLWWAADVVFGLYMRRVPYAIVYGGLAAAIGLLLWMYLTATIILLGAAYNAEAAEDRRSRRPILARQVVAPR